MKTLPNLLKCRKVFFENLHKSDIDGGGERWKCCFLRAYSFGHLKSAKSSENGRLRREKFHFRMGILKTVELADFAEKNTKRIRILKTEGLADFAKKNAKRMGMEC